MTDATDCIFCNIVAGTIPCFRLYEDQATLAFLDINPASVPDDAIAATVLTAKKIAGAVREVLEPDGINLVQCNGPAAAQSVMHFHMHVLPRRHDDKLALNWELTPGDMGALGALAERIRAALG
jgi:histidine triad (HIT) family protein